MPTPTTYTYSIQNDFPNHKVASDRLTQEIQQSAIVTALDSISTAGDACNVAFKDALSAGDKTTLDGIVAVHSGLPLPQNVAQPVQIYASATMPAPVSNDGRQRVSAEKTTSSKATIYTHDWTDPTTWYTASVRVVDEAATDQGAHTVYALLHVNVVDTYHGKLLGEDFLLDAGGNSYRVAVKVNGIAKTEQDPHFGTGGDFTVDYVAGKITFFSALAPTDVVTVTYHYATTSLFVLAPAAGKTLLIDCAEVQFSGDVIVTDSVLFQPYGWVDVFAPQLMPGIPSGTKIPLGAPVVYKSMTDYQADAERAYPVYPVMGGSGWRGAQQPIVVFDWDYVASTVVHSKYGMEVRISLQHDAPFGGWYASATFYCLSDSDA